MNYREMTEQSRDMFVALLTNKLNPWVRCRMVEIDLSAYRTISIIVNSKNIDWGLINDLNNIINAFGVMADIKCHDKAANKMLITIY